jgi:hypothetical protein
MAGTAPPPAIGGIEMEKQHAENCELTIDELDTAVGGAIYQPLIVVSIMRAIAIKQAIDSIFHMIHH